MSEGFISTGLRLWKTARWWRYSVLACASCVIWWGVTANHHDSLPDVPRPPSGSPPPGSPQPPPSTGNAMLDLVTAYEQMGAKESESFDSGSYCETLDEPFRRVSVNDPGARRQFQQLGTRARDALAAAGRCHKLLGESTERFETLDSALSSEESARSRSSMGGLVTVASSLTDFDRSRPSEKPALDKLQSAFAASDRRIGEFMAAVTKFQQAAPPPPSAYQKVAQALEQLGPDRDRMVSPEQKAALAAAESAVRQMKESAGHFSRLASALQAATSDQGAQATSELMEATATISPADQALATDEQKQLLDQARQRIAPEAWKILAEQLRRLRPDAPAAYAAVVPTYRLLKDLPQTGLSDDQRRLLEQGQQAEDALEASDVRLAALLKAAGAWQADGVPGGDGPLEALSAVKEHLKFDKPRFTASHQQAMDILAQANAILHASQLNPGTKDTLPLCVRPAADIPRDTNTAGQIGDLLRESSFKVIADCKQAALAVSVDVPADTHVKAGEMGVMGESHITTAYIDLTVKWANGTELPAVRVEGSTDSDSVADRDDLARAAAVQNVVPKITEMLTKNTALILTK